MIRSFSGRTSRPFPCPLKWEENDKRNMRDMKREINNKRLLLLLWEKKRQHNEKEMMTMMIISFPKYILVERSYTNNPWRIYIQERIQGNPFSFPAFCLSWCVSCVVLSCWLYFLF
jgi:hypothetical protein